MRGSLHNETKIHYTFRSDEVILFFFYKIINHLFKDFKLWQFGCDSDWSEGYSKCDFFKSNQNTAIFQGTLSTKVVKVKKKFQII